MLLIYFLTAEDMMTAELSFGSGMEIIPLDAHADARDLPDLSCVVLCPSGHQESCNLRITDRGRIGAIRYRFHIYLTNILNV